MTQAAPQLPDSAATMEVSAANVASWLNLPPQQRPRLIDCREEEELAVCQMPGNEWYPLGSFAEKLEALTADASRGVVIYCHHGMRSLRGASFLRAHGVESAFSMTGGIDAWSREIDPSIRRY